MRPLLLAAALTTTLHAQFLPGVDPRLPEAAPVPSLPPVRAAPVPAGESGALLTAELRGIFLDSGTGATVETLSPGVTVSADLPRPATLAKLLAARLAHPLHQAGLVAIADAILQAYDRAGFPVVDIDAPEQDLGGGALRLVVAIGKISHVGVARPKYGSGRAVRRGLLLRRGDFVRRAEIDRQLAWFGRTIFRRPQLFVSPGAEPATADLLIGLAEKNPWRATLGYENSGPESLGRDRFSVGAAAMTPGEQVIAWQSVFGAPLSSLQAHAVSWEIPFHRIQQSLQLDGVYADVSSRSENSGLPVEDHGTSWSAAAMWKFFPAPLGRWRQRLAAGIEVKATDQFLLFGGGRFSPGEVRLVDARISHSLGREWDTGGISFDSSLLLSPGGLIAGNSDSDFHQYDPQADSRYAIARIGGQGWWSPGGDWRLALRGAAQIADSRLLPVEQFAAGGWDSVRGVSEREYYADDGWQGSVEIYSPAISFSTNGQLRFLTFLDHAWLRSRGEDANSLSGAGIGLRMNLGGRVDVRADQGWRLDDAGAETHVGVQMAF